MSNLLLGDDATLLSQFLLKTSVYALWYSTLFWLPVRAFCDLIDRWRSAAGHTDAAAEAAYRVGMNVLPPM
jgi:hypothetical protein